MVGHIGHAVGLRSMGRSGSQDLVVGLTGDDAVTTVHNGATFELLHVSSIAVGARRESDRGRESARSSHRARLLVVEFHVVNGTGMFLSRSHDFIEIGAPKDGSTRTFDQLNGHVASPLCHRGKMLLHEGW